MSDEPKVEPLHLVQHVALTVEAWPQAIEVTEEFLRYAHTVHAKIDGDTIRFEIGNGEAEYTIRRDRKHGRGFVAELVEANDRASLVNRRKKYLIRGTEE